MHKPFSFTADSRTYTCTTEERRGTKGEYWWWFDVTGDSQSYAPFQAMKSDTQKSVQQRILAFYNSRLEAIARPVVKGGHFGAGRPPGSKKAAVVEED